MVRVNANAEKGFWLVLGVLAGLYVGKLITPRLPSSL